MAVQIQCPHDTADVDTRIIVKVAVFNRDSCRFKRPRYLIERHHNALPGVEQLVQQCLAIAGVDACGFKGPVSGQAAGIGQIATIKVVHRQTDQPANEHAQQGKLAKPQERQANNGQW